MNKDSDRDAGGWISALVAFGWWGVVFPSLLLTLNYFAKDQIQTQTLWSLEILVHRIFWCVIFCMGLLWARGSLGTFFGIFKNRKTLAWFVVSSILILFNWFGFIIAAATENLNQASLGYYMGPLFNVLLGYLFLGEKLKPLQFGAVLLSLLGIVWLVISLGQLPWIALCLAISFGLYGLVRKKIQVDAIVGLTFETLYCLPLALVIAWFVMAQTGGPVFMQTDWVTKVLLVLTGPATAVPLIAFAMAAKKLRLGTLGFIQFISPTGQLLMAIFINNEVISFNKLIGYAFVWFAVGLYLVDLAIRNRTEEQPVDDGVAESEKVAE